jgi:MFS family permease
MQVRTAAERDWAAGGVSAASEPARPHAASRLGAFRSPAYRLYWIGQLTTNAGSWLQIVASGWLVLELTDSPAALGLNAAFQAIPILALSLVGGVIADRIDRYRLMVWSQVAQIVPDVLLAVLLSLAAPKETLRWLLITGVVLGMSLTAFGLTTAFWPALVALMVVGGAGSASATLANTLLQQVVDERVRGRVMSFFMAATWGSWRLGALPAGLVAQVCGAPLACVLSGVLLLGLLAPVVRGRQLKGG